MELFMAITIGVLFAAGTYLMLRPNLIRVVLGMGLYSNATNLLMITTGGYSRALEAPFTPEGADVATLMDPLPPDIILTAIVISFAVSALFLTICYRVYQDHGTDNPELLPNHEEGAGHEPAATTSAAAAGIGEEKAIEQAHRHAATSDDDDEHSLDQPEGGHERLGRARVPDVCEELARHNPNAPHEAAPKTNRSQSEH